MKLLLLACGWRSGPRGGAVGAGRGTRHAADERVRRTPGTAGHHARPAAHLPKSGDDAGRAGRRPAGGPGRAGRRAGRRRRRTRSADSPAAEAGPAQPVPGRPGRRGQRVDRAAGRPARAAPAPRGRSGRAAARPRRRCRRRSGRPPRAPTAGWRRTRACRSRMWAAYAGNLAPPCSAYVGKLSICTRVGTSAVPRRAISAMTSSVRPVPCSMQSMPAATSSATDCSPKQCAVTRAPSSCARAIAAAATSAGQQGVRSPASRSIQSPTSLTQPSPRAGLGLDLGDQVGRLDLGAVVADVALGAGDVPAGPDDARQVVAVVDPVGVDRVRRRRAAAARRRRGRRPPAPRGRLVDAAVRVQPDVAVRVDQARQHPAAVGDGLGAGDRLVAEQAVGRRPTGRAARRPAARRRAGAAASRAALSQA